MISLFGSQLFHCFTSSVSYFVFKNVLEIPCALGQAALLPVKDGGEMLWGRDVGQCGCLLSRERHQLGQRGPRAAVELLF